MVKRWAALFASASIATAIAGTTACGTDAVGVDACRQIEAARCKRAVECGIPLDAPKPGADPEAACERFYVDACLHGISSKTEPNPAETKACVDAVGAGTCDVVKKPETSKACAFIIPPDTPAADASTDADATAEPDAPKAQPDAAK